MEVTAPTMYSFRTILTILRENLRSGTNLAAGDFRNISLPWWVLCANTKADLNQDETNAALPASHAEL